MLKRKYGITDPALASTDQIDKYFAADQALRDQENFNKAAIERTQRPLTGDEKRVSDRYLLMKRAYDDFITQYADPAARSQFLGLINAPWETLLEKVGWRNAQEIRDFRNALAPFALESLTDEKGKPQAGFEGIAGMAPSVSDSPGAFESNLQHFGDALNDQISLDTNTRAYPVGAITPQVAQGWLDGMQANRLAARRSVFQQSPDAGAAPPPPPPPPAAAAAPPPPPPTAPAWAPNWVR
jgi:hypothetical protein